MDALRSLRFRREFTCRTLKFGAAIALVALATSACSLPFGDRNGPSPGQGAPTVLVVDASASMLNDDAPGPRIDAARAAATGLVEALPGDAVLGLVTYGIGTDDAPESHEAGCRDVTTLASPAELGADGHRAALFDHVARLTPRGFTPIAESLRQAADLLPDGETAIIVISDGEDSCGQPPCEVATELAAQNPGLRISTVGFMTATPELACIARETGGLFVTADDADQLLARLHSARDVDANATALTATGLAGIDIGTHFDELTRAHPTFPGQSDGTREGDATVISYLDCDYAFDSNGTVIEIRPHSARTIDGLTAGAPLSSAVRLYGDPVPDPTDNEALLFTASQDAGTAWKIKVDDDVVSSIVLCQCLPGTGANGPGTTVNGETTIITSRPYLSDGTLDPDYGTYSLEPSPFGCRIQDDFYSCGPWPSDILVYFCSVSDDGRGFCPSGESGNHFFATDTVRDISDDVSQDVLLRLEAVTYRVTLADGQVCTYGVSPGGSSTGAYSCPDGDQLQIMQGGSVFYELPSGTWAARKADMHGRNGSEVTISQAENFIR